MTDKSKDRKYQQLIDDLPLLEKLWIIIGYPLHNLMEHLFIRKRVKEQIYRGHKYGISHEKLKVLIGLSYMNSNYITRFPHTELKKEIDYYKD